METINNLTNAASKAIWGEGQSHEEPVSGKMGNVAAGEPYDAGNIGEPNEAALETSGKKDTETPSEPAIATRTTGRTVPEPMPKPEPEAATKPRFVEAKPTPSETTEEASTSQPANPSGPAGSAPSAVGMRDDSTKAQNDTRPPPEGPSAFTAHTPGTTTTGTTGTTGTTSTTTGGTPDKIPGTAAAISEADTKITTPSTTTTTSSANKPEEHATKAKKEQLQKSSDEDVAATPDLNDLKGPGPRPLEEIAREHGGDAGARSGGGGGPGGLGGEAAAGQHQRRDSGKGLAEDGEKGGAGGGKGVGGEEYVKSSGLVADGGDFDASRPGAGREADRLLEQKGIHPPATHRGNDIASRSGNGQDTHGSHGSHGAENGDKEKLSLKDKIKAKLHKSSTSS